MDHAGQRRVDLSSDAPKSGRAGWPVDPYRVRRAILSSRWKILAAGIIGVIVGYAFVKVSMGNTYTTTVILRYEGDVDVPGLPPTRDVIWPAAEALRNQAVLERIREESGFEGGLTRLGATIGYDVDPVSSTMRIQVGDDSAKGVAEYARLVTEIFTDFHKDRQARRLEAERARVRKRIEAAERESDAARERYNEFRERHGIADLSTEQRSMLESAAQLRADSELATAEIRATEAEIRSLEAQLAATPKTTTVEGRGSPERAAYSRLVEELASARATLSDDHPRVQSLQQQVAQLRAQVRRGGGTSIGGTLAANEAYNSVEARLHEARSRLAAAKARQEGLRDMAEKADARVESFSDIEGQATSLLAEVNVNEGLLAGLRRTEAAVEDVLGDPPSGFIVLDPGAVPEYPERNKMKVVVFGIIVLLTGGLALLLALRREFRGLAPLTPAEVAFWGHGPVLGATSWPDDGHALDELVAGLDDLVPDASGRMLVVASAEDDARLARELAERMNQDWFHVGEAVAGSPAAGPIVTPVSPPSGPYPIGSSGASRTALAVRPPEPKPHVELVLARRDALKLEPWEGPSTGQALRRAARLADRVIVLVRAGKTPLPRLVNTKSRLGRTGGVGYLVVGLPAELDALPDRVGDIAGFWGLWGAPQ